MAVDHLFSIPLGKYKLPNYPEIRDKLLPILEDDYHDADDKDRKAEHWRCNSYQTWLWGNGQEELSNSLFPFVDDYLTQLKFVGFKYSIESWFNIYGKQQYQERHHHGGSLMSCMVVLNYDPEQHTSLRFFNPWAEYARVFEKFGCQAYGISFIDDNHGLEMENGYAYIWPSSLNHLVPPQPNKLKDLRITFTFNVNPDNKWDNFDKGPKDIKT